MAQDAGSRAEPARARKARPKASWKRPPNQKRRQHHEDSAIRAPRRADPQRRTSRHASHEAGVFPNDKRTVSRQTPRGGGGLLLSQQLGHLVLFLQRMPSETSSLAFRRRTGRCDCSAPRSTRCAPGISRGHGGCRTKGVSTDRRRHLLEIHPNGVCQQDYWVVCEIRHVHAES